MVLINRVFECFLLLINPTLLTHLFYICLICKGQGHWAQLSNLIQSFNSQQEVWNPSLSDFKGATHIYTN